MPRLKLGRTATTSRTWLAATSGDFTRSQEVDLVAAGFDPVELDDGPSVRAELWVREMYTSDRWWLRVELRDANRRRSLRGPMAAGRTE